LTQVQRRRCTKLLFRALEVCSRFWFKSINFMRVSDYATDRRMEQCFVSFGVDVVQVACWTVQLEEWLDRDVTHASQNIETCSFNSLMGAKVLDVLS